MLGRCVHLHTDFDGGDVGHLIHVLHGGVVHVPVVELHADPSLIGHNVGIGNDETVVTDDEPRAIGDGDFSSRKRMSVQTKEVKEFLLSRVKAPFVLIY